MKAIRILLYNPLLQLCRREHRLEEAARPDNCRAKSGRRSHPRHRHSPRGRGYVAVRRAGDAGDGHAGPHARPHYALVPAGWSRVPRHALAHTRARIIVVADDASRQVTAGEYGALTSEATESLVNLRHCVTSVISLFCLRVVNIPLYICVNVTLLLQIYIGVERIHTCSAWHGYHGALQATRYSRWAAVGCSRAILRRCGIP